LQVTNFAQSISTEPKTFSVASLTLAVTTVQESDTTAKDLAPAALQLSMSSERVLNIHAVGFSRYGCKRIGVQACIVFAN
jgi:hypothetical protein